MQIIDAIVKSSEEVSVVNVKTSFRVLPNGSSSPKNGGNTGVQQGDEPASKKAKTGSAPPQDVHEYKVTHKLLFEATVSMTSNDGVRYNARDLAVVLGVIAATAVIAGAIDFHHGRPATDVYGRQ